MILRVLPSAGAAERRSNRRNHGIGVVRGQLDIEPSASSDTLLLDSSICTIRPQFFGIAVEDAGLAPALRIASICSSSFAFR